MKSSTTCIFLILQKDRLKSYKKSLLNFQSQMGQIMKIADAFEYVSKHFQAKMLFMGEDDKKECVDAMTAIRAACNAAFLKELEVAAKETD